MRVVPAEAALIVAFLLGRLDELVARRAPLRRRIPRHALCIAREARERVQCVFAARLRFAHLGEAEQARMHEVQHLAVRAAEKLRQIASAHLVLRARVPVFVLVVDAFEFGDFLEQRLLHISRDQLVALIHAFD